VFFSTLSAFVALALFLTGCGADGIEFLGRGCGCGCNGRCKACLKLTPARCHSVDFREEALHGANTRCEKIKRSVSRSTEFVSDCNHKDTPTTKPHVHILIL